MTQSNDVLDVIKQQLKNKQGRWNIWNRVADKYGLDTVQFNELYEQAKKDMCVSKDEFERKCVVKTSTVKYCECDEEDTVKDAEKKYIDSLISSKNRKIAILEKKLGEMSFVSKSNVEPLIPVNLVLPKRDTTKEDISAVLHLSDSHIGEVISKDEMGGSNEYNYEIAKERMAMLMGNLMEQVEAQRSIYNVDDLQIFFTGDTVGGIIHPEYEQTNEVYVTQQPGMAGRLFANAIKLIAPTFKSITVSYVSSDNHGRLSVKNQMKGSGYNNHSFTAGELLEAYLENQKNVKVNLYPLLETVVKVQNRKYLLWHGHTVKGSNGYPYHAIEKKMHKELEKRMEHWEKECFDAVVMGHFHSPMKRRNLYIGGSLSGSTELDKAYSRFCPPIQTTWFVSPSKGDFGYTENILG